MKASDAFRAISLAILLSACSGGSNDARVDPDPGPAPTDWDRPREEPADDDATVSATFATRFVLARDASLGSRGFEILCPDPQRVEIRGTYLSRIDGAGGRSREEAHLCGLELPTFVVSAHGALGGCDATMEARVDPGFDVGAVTQPSELEVAIGVAAPLPVAFLMGATLPDPFGDAIPRYDQTDVISDDDADGNPGVTLIAHGVPVIPEGARLFAAARLLIVPDGRGGGTGSLELSFLGSDAGLHGSTLQVLAPDLREDLVVGFEREEVPAGTTCTDLDEGASSDGR